MNIKTIFSLLACALALIDLIIFWFEKDEIKKVAYSTRAFTVLCLAILLNKLPD